MYSRNIATQRLGFNHSRSVSLWSLQLKVDRRCRSLEEHRCTRIVRSCVQFPALKIKDNQS